MKHESYNSLMATDDYSVIDFFSYGPNGLILKRVKFNPTEYPHIYNLAFGDIDVNGEINDIAISNNKDRNKLLATIVAIVDVYLSKYPDRWIYFTGSSPERTRLYRMAIALNLEELELKYDIYSQIDNGIIRFQKNIPVLGFLIKRKM